MLDPFTIRDGVLEMDAGRGLSLGPRSVDSAAGLVRFADPDRTIPIADLRAVAIVQAERDYRHRLGPSNYETRRRMVLSVVLVPRRAPPAVTELLDALVKQPGEPLERPPGLTTFSAFGACLAVDECSVPVFDGGSAAVARRTAKAIARVAALPMIELFGELCVHRAADGLDLRLQAWLGTRPAAEPGPPPPSVKVDLSDSALILSWSERPAAGTIFLKLAAVVGLASLPLLLAAPPAGVAALLLSALVLAYALRRRRPVPSRLAVGSARVEIDRGSSREEVAVDQLEMIRVADTTLILVTWCDEGRIDLPTPEAAAWARVAIEHHLAPPRPDRPGNGAQALKV